MKKAILIDGNSLMFRAYYATSIYGNVMETSKGLATNAIYAYYNMISKLNIKDYDYICVAFDYGKKTKRHDLLPSYKGGRKKTPEELLEQIPYVKKLSSLMGMNPYEKELIEADDIVGTMAHKLNAKQVECTVITGDKDLLQLVNKHTKVMMTKHGVSNLELYDQNNFVELTGINPELVPDLKGLMGDPSDNLKGIPGIGQKTALKLLQKYGNLETIIEHTDALKGKQKEKFVANYEMGLLCKKIATIDVKSDIDLEVENIVNKGENLTALIEMFKELEFNSILNKIYAENPQTSTISYQTITGVEDDFFLKLKNAKESYLYLEDYGNNYHKSIPLGFAICLDDKFYYINFDLAIKNKDFQYYLSHNEKYVYDIKKIICVLNRYQITFKQATFDLMLASYVINPDTKDDIESICQAFDYVIPLATSIYGKGRKKSIPDINILSEYVAKLVKAVKELKPILLEKIQAENQVPLLELETKLAYCLASMEITGVRVDCKTLNEIKDQYQAIISNLEVEIYMLSGMNFNINSPKQLGEVLFEHLELPFAKKTKTGYSTSIDVLNKLKGYEVVNKILEYRKYSKLISTYLVGIENSLIDGRVHTIYKQALTSTGRLSSIEPNMQNIPIKTDEGRLIRKIFVADHVFFGLDYSQIELRVLAHLSNDENMIQAFNNNTDIHSHTASKIYKKDISNITRSERRVAKTVNFGIIYGQSPYGLSEELNIPISAAKKFIVEYYDSFPKIKRYLDSLVEKASELGYAKTILERKRYIPEINSKNYIRREFAKRTSMNAPIQGSAADIIKIAMVNLYEELEKRNLKSKIVLQIHDELIIDCYEDEFEKVKEIAVRAMEKAYQLKVPLVVDCHKGKNLLEVK